jgi:hypothetical protein
MADQIKVQHVFTLTDSKGRSYTDALYYDYSTYPTVKQSDIDTAKQARLSAWNTELAKTPPPIDLDLAIAESQKQIDYYTQLKADYTAQKGGGK